MPINKCFSAETYKPSARRQIMTGAAAVALGGLIAGSKAQGETSQSDVKEAPSKAANRTRTSLHQEVEMKAPPSRIYEVLLDSKQFAAFSGMPAEIDAKAGGVFSMFGGMIVGRNIEIVPNQRIVQAWRPSHWAPGVYSIVKFELNQRGSAVMLFLDHTGFPQGDYGSLFSGWNSHYWMPLKRFFG
jgi:activator of HSP90 ATPase